MTKTSIIADSSPLISLAIIEKLDLLPQLYQQILLPPAVWDEITVKGATTPPPLPSSVVSDNSRQTSSPCYLIAVHILGTGMLISKTESATNARKEFFKLLDEVAKDSSVVVIKRKDAPNVAMIAESELSSLVETVHLLRSPKNAERLFSALEKSRARDLDTPNTTDPEQALAELRHYCEQTEETDTIDIAANTTAAAMSNL